jgi:hypothetical protein
MGNTLTSTQDSQLSTMDTQDIINYVPAVANFVTQNELSDKLANYLPANSFGPAAAYVTQTQLNELHQQLQQESGSRSANYALQSDVQQNYQPKGNYALATDLNNYVSQLQNYAPAGNYATRNDLINSLAAYQPKGDYQPAGTYATVAQLNQYALVSDVGKNYVSKTDIGNVDISNNLNIGNTLYIDKICDNSGMNKCYDVTNNMQPIIPYSPTDISSSTPAAYNPPDVSSYNPPNVSSFTLLASSTTPPYALPGFHPVPLENLPARFTLMNTATGKYWNAANNQINDGGPAAILSADRPSDLYGISHYRLAVAGVSGYVRHAGYVMWTNTYVPNSYDFAWHILLKNGTTNQVAIWNPFPGDGTGNWVVAGSPTAGRQQIANTTTPTIFTLTPH